MRMCASGHRVVLVDVMISLMSSAVPPGCFSICVYRLPFNTECCLFHLERGRNSIIALFNLHHHISHMSCNILLPFINTNDCDNLYPQYFDPSSETNCFLSILFEYVA